MKYLSLIALLFTACANHAPTAPTSAVPVAAVREMAYDINIPSLTIVNDLTRAYPHGVHTSPVNAQAEWDYTRVYGSPNVYYGETAPACEYVRAGVVVAPLRVASLDVFTATDWPGLLEPGLTYAWVGRFVYTLLPTPGTFIANPTATCTTPKKP